MIIYPTYVFHNLLPNELCTNICSYLIHPFTESRNIREVAIKSFLKKIIIEDLNNHKIDENFSSNGVNSVNVNNPQQALISTKNYIINAMLKVKLNNIDHKKIEDTLNCKPFYQTTDDLDNQNNNPFLFLNYSERIIYLYKTEWLLDIEFNNCKTYWDIDKESIS